MDGFVHLHVHSHYSLLDGGISIKPLVKRAAELGMGALALTDHGNLFGAVEFYRACKDVGIKPILGMEAYISPTTRQDRSFGSMSSASYHMVLLAMNNTGWTNLLRLSSRAYLEGFYYRPRIDRELLRELGEGLICTSACLGGEIPNALLAGDAAKAERIAREYLEIFGAERFFIELQSQGIDEQAKVNPQLVALAEKVGAPLVGTNDVHFLTRQMKPSHEILCCVSTGKTIADSKLHDAYTPEMYLKGPDEMRQALARWPQAADNTLRIAEMCDVEIDFASQHLPVFTPPDGLSDDEYLRQLAYEGLKNRLGDNPEPKYVERLEWELKVIKDKGYSSYFLIVNDFVQYARRNSIPSAPRGSGVATLLGYCLDIANVDPLRYGLLFERFTDPQREEAPDIDIDICQNGRGKVIDYVRQKYGHVAQIITYGTLKARAVIRDVGRVMDIPLPEVDQIAKKVPEGPGVTLAKALEAEPELKKLYDSDNRIHTLIDHALNLEGLARHAGVHAAGVIICSEPLEEIVPLYRQASSEDIITQWDGPTCDGIGLMKMDFLGLRTLTILQRTRELIAAQTGTDVDPEQVPLDDPAVYELFCRGKTSGVFQFESGGMRDLLQKMAPSKIEHLIAANAMYRPGPMELIPAYCDRRHGREEVPSVHELVDDILAETYGIMCYQEQVMQVLNRLGKLPLNRALTLIKAISKKKEKTIEAERPNFLAGAKENGIAEAEAQRLFDLILKFAGYGFNKAHSTRYAIVAYQSAYFKHYHPRQWLAATLTFEASDTAKLSEYLDEAVTLDIPVRPPDINTSEADFTVVGEAVRFGLAAVKGVGSKAVEAILEARREAERFNDLFHFCENVDLRQVNRSAIEALIKAGAFDSLGASRAQCMGAVETAIQLGQGRAADRRSGQMSFFEAFEETTEAVDAAPAGPTFPDVEPWTESQLLAAEKETLGFYITSHPLTSYGRELENLSTTTLRRLEEFEEGQPVVVGCMISEVRPTMVKQGRSAGRKMAMLTVEDLTGQCDCVAFSDTYEQTAELLTGGAMVYLVGNVDRRRESPSLIINDVIPMDSAVERLTGQVLLRLDRAMDSPAVLQDLHNTLIHFKGDCPLLLEVRPQSAPHLKATIKADPQWFLSPKRPLMQKLQAILGEENVTFKGKPATANGNGWRKKNGFGQPAAARGATGPASAAVTRFN